MQISPFNSLSAREFLSLKADKERKESTINARNESIQDNANVSLDEQDSENEALEQANSLDSTQKTNSQNQSDTDKLLKELYKKLQQLQEELKEINAKMDETTDEQLRIELLSQAQNIISQMQKIMAQIMKILNELMKQQKLDARA